ncbi:signal peptidase I [Methylomonas koyamae]|uniref:Signal peptidase I n=1 Tax=Methylomonas koyamae TaxID=702114 RepID=A0A177NG73_9GAMM|nr:signal peptidase I [Methylomonas koyamae]OAI17086.1 signal peptidase I [Methylomonas koyamae]
MNGTYTPSKPSKLRPCQTKAALGWFLLKALPILLFVLAVERYVGQRFLIGGDDQVDRCLPDKWIYLIDTQDKDIWRGDLMAFRAERMAPYFKDGQIIVKIAAGVTGDHIQVDGRQTTINGSSIIEGLPLAEKLKKPAASFERDETIPPAAYWVTGQTAKSFDSRYWGYVYDHQVIGRAYALF